MRIFLIFVLSTMCTLASAGYDLHITRKKFWADETGAKISWTEWHKYIQSNLQIKQDKNNGKYDFIVRTNDSVFPIWYEPNLGELYTKDPTEKAILSLKNIAKDINAEVQGDDGEVYSFDH